LQDQDLTNRIALLDEETGGRCATEQVPCTTLDAALGDHRCAMGKIDIEGAEPLVFGGGAGVLATGNPPVWLVELKDDLLQRYGHSAAGFARQLRDHQYLLGVYDADRRELSFPDQPWQGHGNVIAVFRPHLDDVLQRIESAEGHRIDTGQSRGGRPARAVARNSARREGQPAQ
jgi:hypothetical protein